MKISMPQRINASGLLPFVAQLGQALKPCEEIIVDFADLGRVTPAGLVAFTATIVRWKKEKHPVTFEGLSKCRILGYLQRMDLFAACGFELQEEFKRHEAKGRFVPVRLIDHNVDAMGTALAGCLAPGGEEYGAPLSHLYDLSWYILTEVANNVRQHSRGLGFVSAQVNRDEGFVRMALADNGCGILKSFQDAGFAWSHEMTDSAAILKALEATVSSKGSPVNEGIGLTLVTGLIKQTSGSLLIASGKGVLQITANSVTTTQNLPGNAKYQGTLVGLTFKPEKVNDYAALLHAAKIDAGLLHGAGQDVNFSP